MTAVEQRPVAAETGNLRYVRRLVLGQGASTAGARITEIALPLAAITVFDAAQWQVGLLASLALLPNLLVALPAGAWVDRSRPRAMMMRAALLRVLLMASIPLAYAAGLLSLVQLGVVALVVGVTSVLYDTALAAYVPWLVGREHLVTARSRQTAVERLGDVGGQAAGGGIVDLLGAAWAMLLDAVAFLVPLACLRGMPDMPPPDGAARNRGLLRGIGDGLRAGWASRPNRLIMLEATHYNLAYRAFLVAFLVYVTRDLQLGAYAVGLAMAALSLGAVAGSALAPAAGRRFGVGPAIVGALVLGDLGPVGLAFLDVHSTAGKAVGLAVFFLMGLGGLLSGVLAGSLALAATPARVHGRITGARRVLTRGGSALGGLLGGGLLAVLPSRTVLTICALGMVSAVVWVLGPTIRRVRELPERDVA